MRVNDVLFAAHRKAVKTTRSGAAHSRPQTGKTMLRAVGT
jgi:hypothetical protein